MQRIKDTFDHFINVDLFFHLEHKESSPNMQITELSLQLVSGGQSVEN